MNLIQRTTIMILILMVFSFIAFSHDIHKAVEIGDLATVKTLLKKNPKLAVQVNDVKDLPIRAAILNGHTEVAKVLLAYMDDIDAKNIRATTPLMYAAYAGNEEITKLLIAKGADINHKNTDGRSSLYYAARQGKQKTADLLIKYGAEINSKTNSGDTPLRIAIEQHHQDIIDLLVANNARLNIKDRDDGIYLLHKLTSMGCHKLVMDLIDRGVDKNSRDKMNRTLLHNAAAGGLNNLLSNLIKQDANPNTSDIYGSTPLHEAVFHGHKNTVILLLSNGANVNLCRPDGTTPVHIAREHGNQEMTGLLLTKGAKNKPKVFPELKGDYLGQKKPGELGVIFAPGIISKAESHDSMRGFFDNDTLFVFYQWPIGFKAKWTQWPHFLMKKVSEKWAAPYQSKLVGKPWFFNLESVPKGERMIFAWRKNLDGSGSAAELYLWSSTKTSDGWTKPARFEAPINQGFDTWPSLSTDKTLYFHSWRAGCVGRDDIYMSIPVNGEYKSVKNLGKIINTKHTEHDPYVAPDGSYLLYSSFKPGGYGEDDIYITYRKVDGTWTTPINLGDKINSKYSDNRVYLSPDGKYLFYTSLRTGNLDIYWVDAKIIEELRPDEFKKGGL